MDHDLNQELRTGQAPGSDLGIGLPDVDWVDAEAGLDGCDGYLVMVVDPQTGEVDAHGPYTGVRALHAADETRTRFDREELDDVVVRIVRYHRPEAA